MRQQHPIIVLDGPDGVGKTTLGESLAKYCGGHLMHQTYRFKGRMFDYHTAVIELALKRAAHQPVIIDRWWASEYIYAEAFRGGSPWPMAKRLLDRVGLKHGVTYINCLPDDRDAYLAHFNRLKGERVEMYDTMGKVYDLYKQHHEWTKDRRDTLHYDFMKWEFNDVAAARHFMELADDFITQVPDYGLDINERSVAGNLINPKLILVGELSNPKSRRAVWPFFEHANSSLWLTNALEQVGIPEWDLAMVNAYLLKGPQESRVVNPLLKQLSDDFPTVPMIPLGQLAYRALYQVCGEPPLALKHPQYMRRFKPDDLSGYQLLREYI